MLTIIKRNGEKSSFTPQKIYNRIKKSSKGLDINHDEIFIKVITSVPTEGTVTTKELDNLISQISASYTSTHYDYSKFAAIIAISSFHKESSSSFYETMKILNDDGVINGDLIKIIESYGAEKIDSLINHDMDYTFDYFGWISLKEMYLLKNSKGKVIERPQYMYMRVALWTTHNLEEAIEYYNSLSNKLISKATPIMINSGTKIPQLASCVLKYNEGDSREDLLGTLKDISVYSADAAGIGLCMSNIRSKESKISTSGGNAGGLLKYLKIVNESLRFFNQQGRRPGSAAVYIEPWHKDVFDLLDIKKNTGAEELRARDLFTALWLPDNFLRAVEEDGDWYLFCPNDIVKSGLKPLQEIYGEEYEEEYNKAVELGLGKKIKAQEIWIKIIESQIETGVPYLCSKDNANKKSNHKNIGTIKQSNLCSEIFQFTDESNTAICTLSSLVLKNFVKNKKFDFNLLLNETRKIVRSLNKVININSYSTEKGKKGGLEQRALGIGVQGLADTFFLMDYIFDSDESKKLNKEIFETIYYGALLESMTLCKEKLYEPYKFFENSPFSEGTFQFDMWGIKSDELSGMYDWDYLKNEVKKYGVCNSLLTTIMPVACQTIDTKIITKEGVKSFQEICEENEIDFKNIEKNNVSQWFKFKNPIMVKTMDGFEESDKIYFNGKSKVIEIEMEDGYIFKCSEEHKFLVKRDNSNEWIKVKDLKEGDDIVNVEKITMKIKKITLREEMPLWDIEVKNVHHYIMENGCVSHNSSAKVTGSYEMTEPAHSAIFNRRVVGGEIIIVNKYLIDDLNEIGLWNEDIKNEIIMNDGSIQNVNFIKYIDIEDKKYESKIKRIEFLIKKYRTVWEIPQREIINMAIGRAPFIDQSQSMNIYMSNPTVPKLTSAIFYGWKNGLKTLNYYLRTKAISTGAKHLAIDVTKNIQSKIEEKPEDSPFDCVGCSA
jgi:ribonucleoside-diphosphate reductase alpha chain